MEHFYATLLAWAQAHGMKAVFVFMAVENLGVPWPTEAGFLAAQGLVRAKAVNYWWAYTVITLGHLFGAGVSYYLGRAGDSAFARHFTHSPRLMRARDRLQHWYERYGPFTLLFGRLVGQVRPWASIVAGMARVPQTTFWLWTVIGSLIYTAIAMWMTAWGWGLWEKYPQIRTPGVVGVLLVFYGLALYAVTVKLLQRAKRKKAAARALEETATDDEPEAAAKGEKG